MIRHYFKTGFRNLLKYKTQSFISIIGLAIGLTFFSPLGTIGIDMKHLTTAFTRVETYL